MIQDIKRLIFFQKGRTFVTLTLALIALNCACTIDFGQSRFSFLSKGKVARKISHIKELHEDSFVMGRTKSGLEVVGLRESSQFIKPLLQEIQEVDLVVSGVKCPSKKRRIKIGGRSYEALFTPIRYSNKALAFTTFTRANEMLKSKEYFSVQEGYSLSAFLIQIASAFIFLAASTYFVYLKSRLIRSLACLGISSNAAPMMYAVVILALSISASFVLFIYKLALLCALFFVCNIVFKKEVSV